MFLANIQLSVTLLLRYRTLNIFRIGYWWHPSSRSIFEERYSGYPESSFFRPPTRLSRFVASHSRELQVGKLRSARVQTPHPRSVSGRVRFVLFRFGSPLLTESIFFLFFRLLKCFNPADCPSQVWCNLIRECLPKQARSRIRLSRVRRLHTPTPCLSQFAAAFIVAQSQAIRHTAYCFNSYPTDLTDGRVTN